MKLGLVNRAPLKVKKLSEEHKKKLSEALRGCTGSAKGKKHSEETRAKMSVSATGKNNGMYGKTHTKKTRAKMSRVRRGKKHSEETKQKLSAALTGRISPMKGKKHSDDTKQIISDTNRGKNAPGWKGGYATKNIPRYDLYAPHLEPYEECRRNEEDPNILDVKCTYCGKWFTPTCKEVSHRIGGINSNDTHRFYCLDACKQECSIYKKIKYSVDRPKNKNGKTDLAIEVPPEFRQMVFARDNHTCQRCGSTKSLHCHHIVPKKLSPMEAVDLDNGIALCKHCHKWVHKNIKGCGYKELADC